MLKKKEKHQLMDIVEFNNKFSELKLQELYDRQ